MKGLSKSKVGRRDRTKRILAVELFILVTRVQDPGLRRLTAQTDDDDDDNLMGQD